jgi:hypothetical protein
MGVLQGYTIRQVYLSFGGTVASYHRVQLPPCAGAVRIGIVGTGGSEGEWHVAARRVLQRAQHGEGRETAHSLLPCSRQMQRSDGYGDTGQSRAFRDTGGTLCISALCSVCCAKGLSMYGTCSREVLNETAPEGVTEIALIKGLRPVQLAVSLYGAMLDVTVSLCRWWVGFIARHAPCSGW